MEFSTYDTLKSKGAQKFVTGETNPDGTKRGAHFASINNGVISTLNSSSTPLPDSAEFEGIGEDVSEYSKISVFMDADIDGSLSMEFSTDNVNWDHKKISVIDIEMASGSPHEIDIKAKYFRSVFTNSSGNGAQTHFRLQTIFHKVGTPSPIVHPDEVISKTNDCRLTRVSNDVLLDIARGLYSDKASIHKFGHSDSVPTGSFGDIWTYAATDQTYNWPITAEKFRAKAGNAADAEYGLGAWSVQIIYLDSTGIQRQERLTLQGAAASTQTTFTATRFIRSWTDQVGTINGSNTGEIVFENVSSGLIVGSIDALRGQTEMSMYTVPLGWTAYLKRVSVDVATGSNKDCDINFWQRQNALKFIAPFGAKRIIRHWDALQGESIIKFEALPKFPELTDFWFEAKGSGATSEVDIDYDLICIKNEAPTIPQ